MAQPLIYTCINAMMATQRNAKYDSKIAEKDAKEAELQEQREKHRKREKDKRELAKLLQDKIRLVTEDMQEDGERSEQLKQDLDKVRKEREKLKQKRT